LRLEVADDGLGLPAGAALIEGIGLGNTRARLRRAYGSDHELTVAVRAGGGVRATLTLPPDVATPSAGRRSGARSRRGGRSDGTDLGAWPYASPRSEAVPSS
jgi:signal transduction histidine kinase